MKIVFLSIFKLTIMILNGLIIVKGETSATSSTSVLKLFDSGASDIISIKNLINTTYLLASSSSSNYLKIFDFTFIKNYFLKFVLYIVLFFKKINIF